MASPCDYIYRGKKYTHNEFRTHMINGEFENLVSKKQVKIPSYASTQSEEQQQKGNQPSSVEEHAGIEQAGSEVATTSAKGSDSNIGGKVEKEKVAPIKKLSKAAQDAADTLIGKYNAVHGKKMQAQERLVEGAKKRVEKFADKIRKYTKGSDGYKKAMADHEADKAFLAYVETKPPKRSPKNQSKRGNDVTGNMKEREALIKHEPATQEEYIMQQLLAMSDNRPEDKFSKKSLGKNIDTGEGSTEAKHTNQFVHKDGKVDIDQWANELADKARAEGIPLRFDDPQEITNTLYPLLTDFESKADLQERLKEIFDGREEQRRLAEEAAKSDHLESERLDVSQAEIESKLSDEARYEREKAIEEIDNTSMTDEEAKIINDFFDSIRDDEGNIDLDHPNSEAWSETAEAVYSKLGEEASYLFASMLDAKKEKNIQDEINGQQQTEPPKTGESRSDKSESGNEGVRNPESAEEKPRTKAERIDADISDISEKMLHKQAELDIQKKKLKQAVLAVEAAKKKGNEKATTAAIDEYNKIKDLVSKKERAMELLESQYADAIDKRADVEDSHETKNTLKKTADNIRAFSKKLTKGSEGMVGAFPGVSPKLVGKFIDKVADFVESIGNLHAAIYKAIEWMKSEHPDEKDLNISHMFDIKDQLSFLDKPQQKEPVLSISNEEVAKGIVDDIKANKMSYEEAIAEVMADEDISDKTKGKILNYIDWQTKDRDTFINTTLREEKKSNKYLDEYPLIQSEVTSRYLSGETLQEIHGKDVQFDLDTKEKQLADNIVQDSANMVGLAKSHAGSDDITVYGPEMLSHIKKLPDGGQGQGVKKLLAVTGLHNEIQAERTRLENEIPSASAERKGEIDKALKTLTKMSAQTEILYRDITSNASNVMNAAKANRIYRNTFFADMYADKILDEKTAKDKAETQAALDNTAISDKATEEGSLKTEKESKGTVAETVKSKEKSESGKNVSSDITGKKDKKEPATGKEKGKNVIEKIKEKITRKKPEGDTRKEVISKEQADKKAKEYLGDMSIDDLIKKAREQTKKPC